MEIISHPHKWNHLSNPILGPMLAVNNMMVSLETINPRALPNIRKGEMIFIGSDYSGEQKNSRYYAISIIFTVLENIDTWENERGKLREKYLPDGRRISYKNLGDKLRNRILIPFLSIANNIPGIIITILVDKQIESFFQEDENILEKSLMSNDSLHWKDNEFEKLMQVIHWCSFFLAGLSREGQNVLWITDEDAIIPNNERLYQTCEVFSRVSSHYLPHNLGHMRIGTTKSDTGKRDIEDLIAIPDLVAGTLCHVLTEYWNYGGVPSSGLILPSLKNIPDKTKKIMNWFSDDRQLLKRLVICVNHNIKNNGLSFQLLKFHGVSQK